MRLVRAVEGADGGLEGGSLPRLTGAGTGPGSVHREMCGSAGHDACSAAREWKELGGPAAANRGGSVGVGGNCGGIGGAVDLADRGNGAGGDCSLGAGGGEELSATGVGIIAAPVADGSGNAVGVCAPWRRCIVVAPSLFDDGELVALLASADGSRECEEAKAARGVAPRGHTEPAANGLGAPATSCSRVLFLELLLRALQVRALPLRGVGVAVREAAPGGGKSSGDWRAAALLDVRGEPPCRGSAVPLRALPREASDVAAGEAGDLEVRAGSPAGASCPVCASASSSGGGDEQEGRDEGSAPSSSPGDLLRSATVSSIGVASRPTTDDVIRAGQ